MTVVSQHPPMMFRSNESETLLKVMSMQKIQFYCKLEDGKLQLNRRPVFDAYLSGLKDGDYYLTIQKCKGAPKTVSQLAYYFAVIIPTVYQQLIDDGNETFVVKIGKNFKEVPLTKDTVDLLLKEACAYPVRKKRDMTKLECSEFIDKCIRWAARWLSCVIPPPDKENTNDK